MLAKRFALIVLAALALAAPSFGRTGSDRVVACTVRVDYRVDGALRYPYRKDFVVAPGGSFEDDFSGFVRQRYLTAAAHDEDGRVVVEAGYSNDVGVFEYVEAGIRVRVPEDGSPGTATGKDSYFTNLGTAGEHTTEYSLTCRRADD